MTNTHQQPKRSSHRGVCWHSGSGKWRAYFGRTHLGLYDDEITAAVVAYRRRLESRASRWEDAEIAELSEFLGPISTSRRWTWGPRRVR